MYRILKRLYNYHFSEHKNFVRRLNSLVKYKPLNPLLFKLAFFHKSSLNERATHMDSNERLEFLGDAILSSVVAEYLFKKYPNSHEGFLTKMRSKIVKRKTLNIMADKIGIDELLQEFNNTQLTSSMMGNALEAFLGAIYLECGYKKTKNYVINNLLREYINIHDLETSDDNFKSQLLEWCQKHGKDVGYTVLSKFKMDHRDRFKVAVLIDGEEVATAEDFNKKSAEQMASSKAIADLGIHSEIREMLNAQFE